MGHETGAPPPSPPSQPPSGQPAPEREGQEIASGDVGDAGEVLGDPAAEPKGDGEEKKEPDAD